MKLKNLLLLIWIVSGFLSCKKEKQVLTNVDTSHKIEGEDFLLMKSLPDTINEENHSFIMDAILGKPKHDIKNIGILVYNGVNDLDLMGPRYILGQSGATTKLISISKGNIKTVMGVEIVPNCTIADVNQLDILVIPGGAKGTIEAAYNDSLLVWIKMIDKNTLYTASVCTGGWILGATGLLKGKNACTNWYREEEFLKKYGAIPIKTRYTHDGKYWTSAGVTAGMDMSLAIINDNFGKKFTQGIMLDMEYDPAPPIVGGSPEKTGFLVEWMMKAMYDSAIQPAIDSLEKSRN